MHFENGHLYHVYNQGNNRRKVFFTRENYLFFLNKIRKHITPYCEILAWCLMPNHFHLMIYIKDVASIENLNKQIGIILASYARAVNKQEGNTGSLFRGKTKAECITCNDQITPSWFRKNGVVTMNSNPTIDQYPQICYNYILNNPVKAQLVSNPEDWDYSSAKDIMGLRSGTLINKALIEEYELVFPSGSEYH